MSAVKVRYVALEASAKHVARMARGTRILPQGVPTRAPRFPAKDRRPAPPDSFILKANLPKEVQPFMMDLAQKFAPGFDPNTVSSYGAMQSVILRDLPVAYEKIYVETLARRLSANLPIPCNPFRAFRFPAGDIVALESKPSSQFMTFIKQTLGDFEKAGVDAETMKTLHDIDWKRQIRLKLLFYQDPKITKDIVDKINAAFPQGIECPGWDHFTLDKGTPRFEWQWWFRRDAHGRTVFKENL